MPESSHRLVIACGGTGGHLFPGIGVAEAWSSRGGEVLLLISEKQIDTLATEGYSHLQFRRLKSIAMPKITSPKMVGFMAGFAKGLWQCRKIIGEFQAEAVLGMGGFTSTAPLVAGRLKGCSTFVHESNAIPGRANRLNARFANEVLVGFETCAGHFGESKKVSVVGTPLRPSVAERPSRDEAIAHFGLNPELRTLMVMGGSQGARRVNELVAEALEQWPADRLQVLHITGPQDYEWVKPAFDKAPVPGAVIPFCADIQFAYAAADLAVCRSGASSLTELSHYGVPSVLIPYPFAADDHQARNAEIFSDPGAAEFWPQDELDGAGFATRIVELLTDDGRLAAMRSTMETMAVPDASERICETIKAAISGN